MSGLYLVVLNGVKNIFTKLISSFLFVSTKLKKCFGREFFNESSIHVFNRFFKSQNSLKRRIFWIFVAILTFGFCTYQIVSDVQRFKSDTYVQKSRSIREDELGDLNISICFSHWALWIDIKDVMYRHNLTKGELKALTDLFANDAIFDNVPMANCSDTSDLRIALKKLLFDPDNDPYVNITKIVRRLMSRHLFTSDYGKHPVRLVDCTDFTVKLEFVETGIRVCSEIRRKVNPGEYREEIAIIYQTVNLEGLKFIERYKYFPNIYKKNLSHKEIERIKSIFTLPIGEMIAVKINGVTVDVINRYKNSFTLIVHHIHLKATYTLKCISFENYNKTIQSYMHNLFMDWSNYMRELLDRVCDRRLIEKLGKKMPEIVYSRIDRCKKTDFKWTLSYYFTSVRGAPAEFYQMTLKFDTREWEIDEYERSIYGQHWWNTGCLDWGEFCVIDSHCSHVFGLVVQWHLQKESQQSS